MADTLSGGRAGNTQMVTESLTLIYFCVFKLDLKEMEVNELKQTNSAKNRDYWRVLANAAFSLPVP